MGEDGDKIELLRGTLDMLILRTLLLGPAHGHQIAKHIQRRILLSFGKRGLALTLRGLAIGLVLAAFAARLLTTLLYGFRPSNGPAMGVVSLILITVAALACLIPARRASRIDPMVALRHE